MRRDSTHGLSDLKRPILVAVLDSTAAIHVLPTEELSEGEIKAGEPSNVVRCLLRAVP